LELASILFTNWDYGDENINIVREEMIKIGGQEILMPSLHPKEKLEITADGT
jgi:prolyl-tRNA synthetase